MLHRKVNRFLKELRVNIGKFIFDRKENKKEFKLSEIKKIIFLMYRDKIGDSIVNTIMYKELKKVYPEIEITVLTGKAGASILKNNFDIDKIVIWENKKNIKNINLLKELRKKNYDLLINLDDFNFFKSLYIVNVINATVNMGFNKEDYKIYDVSINWKQEIYHESDKCIEILKKFDIFRKSLNYSIYLSEEEMENAQKFWRNKKGLKIVLNFYGASKHRTFHILKCIEILKELRNIEFEYSVGIIFPPDKKKEILKISEKAGDSNVYIVDNILTIRESAAIVKKADVLITPETSLVHIASAFEIPQIAIYRDKTTKEVWAPLYKNFKMIVTGKRDINDINIKMIIEGLKEFYKNNSFLKLREEIK